MIYRVVAAYLCEQEYSVPNLLKVSFSLLVLVVSSACANNSSAVFTSGNIPSLQLSGDILTSNQALEQTTPIPILTLTPQLTDYFDQYIYGGIDKKQRARLLRNLLLSPAFLDIEYERSDNFTASEVFDVRSANCISFSNLYIALARHYGIDADYQLIEKYPEWARDGRLVFMDIHVNASVPLGGGEKYQVDISQPEVTDQSQQKGNPKLISDDVAAALFYSNLAVRAFAQGDIVEAYQKIVWSLYKAPDQSMFWSNLGPIFRANNQLNEAERVYLIALQLDPKSYSASNNLAVLYRDMQRMDKYQYYLAKTLALRQKNPYFYFHLAHAAKQEGDYLQAIKYLRRAIELKDDAREFYELLDVLSTQIERLAVNDVN